MNNIVSANIGNQLTRMIADFLNPRMTSFYSLHEYFLSFLSFSGEETIMIQISVE